MHLLEVSLKLHNLTSRRCSQTGSCSLAGVCVCGCVPVARLTSLRSQAHPVGQNREAGVVKEAGAGQVHLASLQPKLLQLLGEQAKLFALAPAFLLQLSNL